MTKHYFLPQLVNKSNVLDCLDQVQQQLSKCDGARLEVDGSQVSQIDSAGIALLIELSKLAKLKQALKLINLSPSINNLCTLYQVNL